MDHLQQRNRLQSVSLDGLVLDPDLASIQDLPQLRHNMETISFEDLKHLDFEKSNILRHLTQELRTPGKGMPKPGGGLVASSTNVGGPPNGHGASRVQPDLTRSLTPSPKHPSESNISYDMLRDENVLLRQEVDALGRKVAKMIKLEGELDKIQQSYLLLLNSTEKRELLENAMRKQLEREKHEVKMENEQLREQLENEMRNISSAVAEEHNHALRSYEAIILKLTAKNKELTEGQKRQEIELAAQKSTLDEQRNHIRILDSALLNAQANVARLESDERKSHPTRPHPLGQYPLAGTNGQRKQPSDESVSRPANWQMQKLSSDSLNADSHHSSMEIIRSSEELSYGRLTRPLDVSSQMKTTCTPRPDIAVAVSKPRGGVTGPTRAFPPAAHRISFPNLTALPMTSQHGAGRINEDGQQYLPPTNHQRPKSAASVVRETRTEQWQV